MILYLENVLMPETCASLRYLYDQFRSKGSQLDYNRNKVVHYYDLPKENRLALGILALQAQALVLEHFKERHEVESVFLSRLGTGNIHEPHYDNVKPDGVTPNHTAQRSHSSLFYLSGEFDGGELVFPKQDRKIKPTMGSFVAFPSGAPYLHHVQEVRGGWRYTAPVWFTQDPKRILKEVSHAPQDGQ